MKKRMKKKLEKTMTKRKRCYEFAVAIATQAEIEAGAACGQLAIISEN